MSTPSTTERCRLEYDDGNGVDFATPADALFYLCYGREVPVEEGAPKRATSMLGVKHVCKVVHTDEAQPMVVSGEPFLNHVEPVHGDVIWDRAQLDELVAAAHVHKHKELPAVDGIAGLGVGNDGELTEKTIDVLTANVVEGA